MTKPMDFQSIMMALQEFWARQGCLIWQPYYAQVGAGTMNPGTILRVLGPEPWRVGYVEPSIRPDDGRYGENPNRMQMHYQFQVILKPDPGNPLDIYLQSLEALGIDPRQHDIRFVEDNWESPALGAWGLGWEVWLDGQEITQYTYFQQAGGQTLDPVSVEITYGLERIAIALQQVGSFRDIQWNATLTDGDVNLQAEQEHSRYYFETADVGRLHQMFDLFEAEAEACLANKLVLPAHDYVLKCSHTFNVLDTRGAIGVTERQAYFGRMRDLSRRVAEAYLEQRQHLEFPWLDESQGTKAAPEGLVTDTERLSVIAPKSKPFLLEIGTEELPVGDLETAIEQLSVYVPDLLDELRLEHGDVRIQGTPRRLVVVIDDLAPSQSDLEQEVKGPPAERAFDADGNATNAAMGFARSKGVSVEDLETREIDGGRYVVALVREGGRSTPAVLAEALPGLLSSIRFDKSMRWNSTNLFFSRPIRWLLALYGEQTVPFEFAGLVSGKVIYGLRFLEQGAISVGSPEEYSQALEEQGIILDVYERQNFIQSQIKELATGIHGEIADDPDLLREVTNLVEAPAALRGSFDPSHLDLPREVLVSVMKKHQRYFPVEKDGKLLPYFIAVANKPSKGAGHCEGADVIIDGNEHVVRARFADAAYFIREDVKRPLQDYLPRLKTLTFQVDLGSMLDKTLRIQSLVEDLIPMVNLTSDEVETTHRAAELCKADLVTYMVVEMTSLQGYIGGYYALQSGEPRQVADAISEHYLPRYAGDASPSSRPGLVVGLADRLDTLAGLFAAGLAPSGSKDPFAQRRAALGLVQNLIEWDMSFDLKVGLAAAVERLPIPASPESQAACLEFIIKRLRNDLLEKGWQYDVLDAVLAEQGENPARAARSVSELSAWVERPDWHTILPAYSRCVRITRDYSEVFELSTEYLVEAAEQELYRAMISAEKVARKPGSADDFLKAFTPLIPAINRFFDDVLVMTDDEQVRNNRLGLLQRLAALADGVADMSYLEGF